MNFIQIIIGFLTSRLGQEITQDIIDDLLHHLHPLTPRQIADQMTAGGHE